MTRSLGVPLVSQRVADGIRALLGARAATLHRLEAESGDLVAVATSGDTGPGSGWSTTLPRGTGLAGVVVREGRAVVTEDIFRDPRVIFAPETRAVVAAGPYRAALGVPLTVDGRVIGTLAVSDTEGRVFGPVEVGLAQAFADQAAVALENARLFALETSRRAQREAIAAIGRDIAAILDRDRLLGLIVERVADLLGVNGWVYLLDEGGVLVRHIRSGPFEPPPVPIPAGRGVLGQCIERQRGAFENNYQRWPHRIAEVAAAGVTRVISSPLIARGRFLGAIGVDRVGESAPPFTSDDLDALDRFALLASVAIDNARLYADAVRRQREAEVLAELVARLNRSLDVDAVLPRVAEAARELVQSDMAGISLPDPAQPGAMRSRYRVGMRQAAYRPVAVDPGRGASGLVLTTGRPFRTACYAEDPRITKDYLPAVEAEGLVAYLVVPIGRDGRVEGLLFAGNRGARSFTDRDEAVLLKLADHAAIALRNAELFDAERAARREAEAGQRVQDLVQGLDAIVWERDLTTSVLTFMSHRAEALLGYPVERWLTEPDFWSNHLHPDDRERALASQAVVGHGRGELEYRLVADDGRAVWFQDTVRVIRDANGRPSQLRGVMVDVTARKLTEEIAARLHAENDRRRRRAEALASLGHALAQSLEPAEIGRQVVERVRDGFGAVAAVLSRLDLESAGLPVVAVAGDTGPRYRVGLLFPPGTGCQGLAAREGRPAATPDVLADPRIELTPELRGCLEAAPFRATLSVPLLGGNRVTGTLCVCGVAGRTFDAEEVELAQAFADQAALALDNARLFHTVQRELGERRRAEALLAGERHVLGLIAADVPLGEVLDTLCRMIEDQTVGMLCSVLLLDPDGTHLRHGAAPSLPRAYVQAIDGIAIGPAVGSCGTAAYLKELVIVADVTIDPRWADYRDLAVRHGLRACWSVPILGADQRVLGTFAIYYPTPTSPGPAEAELVERGAKLARIALEHRRAREQAQGQAEELRGLAERLLATARTKEEFLVGVSHELGTPLTAIKAYVDTLAADPAIEPATRQRFLGTLQGEVDRLARLIGNILDASRLETRRLDYQMASIDLRAIAAEVAREARPRRRVSRATGSTPLRVKGDRDRLKQGLVNLVDNAIKFSPPDTPVLLRGGVEGSEVVLRVFDRGPGIPEGVEGRLFRKFERVRAHGDGGPPGSGLGLYLAAEMVRAHGGTIGLERHPGWGAVFAIRLPRGEPSP